MSFFLSGIGNLQILLDNCCQREQAYFEQPQGQRRCADPFVFVRAALIFRKRQDHRAEREICERWDLILQDFERQPGATGAEAAWVPGIHLRNRKRLLDQRGLGPSASGSGGVLARSGHSQG